MIRFVLNVSRNHEWNVVSKHSDGNKITILIDRQITFGTKLLYLITQDIKYTQEVLRMSGMCFTSSLV